MFDFLKSLVNPETGLAKRQDSSKIQNDTEERHAVLTLKDVFGREWGDWDGEGDSGLCVNSDTAMREATVMTCVRILAETTSQLPVQVLQRTGSVTTEVKSHPASYRLSQMANDKEPALDWKKRQVESLALRGNAYNFKTLTKRGELDELYSIHPDYVTPYCYSKERGLKYDGIFPGGKVYYNATHLGYQMTLTADEMLKFHGLCSNGLFAINPIEYTRLSLELSKAGAKYGARIFKNNARPDGVIEYPGKPKDDAQITDLLDKWNNDTQGIINAGKTKVLVNGATYKTISMTSKDAQWLELRGYQRGEIGSIFRIPLYMLNDPTGATFNNAELFNINFLNFSLMAWLVMLESGYNTQLLTRQDYERGLFIRHDLKAFLRGDAVARATYYKGGITDGWLTRNEVRDAEGYNPIDGADVLLQPLNYVPIGTKFDDKNQPIPGGPIGFQN